MMSAPVSAEEVADAVLAHPRVAARGAGTKEVLIGDGEVVGLHALSGITEYEASEYTFTARAGTRVSEVVDALQAKGQSLPFDPMLVEAGATLGGTVASGLSGPGRFRYGGLRDFLIGVQFVDGAGKLVRSGGKVVKNAAGFDLPKFLVGSLGRFGILTELSFKVFPAPVETRTLRIVCPDHTEAVKRLAEIASSRWEADALDYDASKRTLYLRLGGPGKALDLLCREIEERWPGEGEQLEDASVWSDVKEVRWVDAGDAVVKVPVTPSKMVELERQLDSLGSVKSWYSSGGAVAWLSCGDSLREGVHQLLVAHGLQGLAIRGGLGKSLWLGKSDSSTILKAVKLALDPEGRFPAI